MIASTLPLLRSVCPDFLTNFAFRPRVEYPLYPILCSRAVLEAASYFVLADMLEECDPRLRAAGGGTAEHRREPAFIGSLQGELERRRYRPGAVLRLVKGPFDYPRRQFSFVKDRIVHTALLLVLEAALAGGAQDCVGNLNTLAVLRATVLRGSRDFEAFDLDRRDVRDGASWPTLLRLVVAHVKDDDVLRLLKLFLKAPVVNVQGCEGETG